MCERDVLVGMMRLWEKQKELGGGNEAFCRLAGLEKGKYQNEYYVPRISVQCQRMTLVPEPLDSRSSKTFHQYCDGL